MADEKFMKEAFKAARKGIRSGQAPFGACIVKDGKRVVATHNHVWKETDITAHAEIHAIRIACIRLKTIDLSGCEIFSTCEPCPMCFSAIHWSRISRIVYGATISDAGKAGFNELPVSNRQLKKIGKSTLKIKGPFFREDARRLFTAYFQRQDACCY